MAASEWRFQTATNSATHLAAVIPPIDQTATKCIVDVWIHGGLLTAIEDI